MRNTCSKAISVFKCPEDAGGFVAALRFSLVFYVLSLTYVAQILKTVIRSVTVHVVNLTFRPFSNHVQPCKPMALVNLAVYRGYKVSFFGQTSRYRTLGCAWLFKFPSKNARVRIVVKNLLESVLCQHTGTLTHFRKGIT